MVAGARTVPLPHQWAWQAVLLMTGLASLIHWTRGEYLRRLGVGVGVSNAEGEAVAVGRGEKVIFSRE